MKKKFNCKHVIIKVCTLQDDDFLKLYHIFRATICPGMKEGVFEAYYKSKNLEYIDVSFFYSATSEIVGFCAAAFYTTTVNDKQVTIARSATGILPEFRGNSLGKWNLYSKYMRYKWHHPFSKLILTIYACNPFIYSMVCKYTGIVYPKINQQIPNAIIDIKNEMLKNNNLQKRESKPFVVKINFEVEKSKQLRTQAAESNNKHVRFFVQQTGLEHKKALLLIIPVSFKNIFMCILLFINYFTTGKIKFIKIFFSSCMKKSYNLVSGNLIAPKNYADRKGM